jgi:uncharacterized protein DUF2703
MEADMSGPAASDGGPARRRVQVEFLYLDLTTCSRCIGTDENLEAALALLRPPLTAMGVAVQVRRTLVATPEQARDLGFVSSPS